MWITDSRFFMYSSSIKAIIGNRTEMTIQPSFGKWLPVALMVGVFAGLAVLASLQLGPALGVWVAAPWVMFISWGLYFMAGAKPARMHKYFFGLTGGIAFGVLTILVSAPLTEALGPVWGLPVTVFLAATLIVLLELTSWFELAPAYFFTYAGFFAYVFGNFVPDATLLMQAFYYWILTMAGLALGYLTATIKTGIFNVERVPFDQRNTVFDKE